LFINKLPLAGGKPTSEDRFLSAEIDAIKGEIVRVRIERKMTKAEAAEIDKKHRDEKEALKAAQERKLAQTREIERAEWERTNPLPVVPPPRGFFAKLLKPKKSVKPVSVELPADREARFEQTWGLMKALLDDQNRRAEGDLQERQSVEFLAQQYVPISSWEPAKQGAVTTADDLRTQAALRKTLVGSLGAWMKDDIRYLTRESVLADSMPYNPSAFEPRRTGWEWAGLLATAAQKARAAGDKSLLGGPTYYQRVLAVDLAEKRAIEAAAKAHAPYTTGKDLIGFLADAKKTVPTRPDFLDTRVDALGQYMGRLQDYKLRIAELRTAQATGQFERVQAFKEAGGCARYPNGMADKK
jgi:hypothetical protein